VLGAALVVCVVGWRCFYFLADDAYIAFRYVSNHALGFGFTWNAPPFAPVEGYTSFLWVVLLRAVWGVTGVAPPVAANAVSLLCALGSLILTAVLVIRLVKQREVAWPLRTFLILVLLGTVSNRTFLAWTSSGLETALFNLLLHAWLLVVLTPSQRSTRRIAWLTTLVSLLSLTRPDGYLFVAATLLIVGLEFPYRSARRSWSPWLALAPLGLVAAHVLWRKAFYGEWLPNTYYAKSVGPWPEAGVRYLAAFVLEYGLWFWALFVGAALLVAARAGRGKSAACVIAVGCVLAHAAYYTFIVGGDHFEFRVYSQLVPLLMVAMVWALLTLQIPARWAVAVMLAFVVLSWPIPWTHWARTHTLETREQTRALRVPVADAFPPPLGRVAAQWDALQDWLIGHHVGMRHQEHKVLHAFLADWLPGRAEGSQFLEHTENPVIVATSVGVVGWAFPHVHVIDQLGLNDYVIARTPLRGDVRRSMAHDRRPPPGYVASFEPNVAFDAFGNSRSLTRETPLSDERIREIESHFRALVASP